MIGLFLNMLELRVRVAVEKTVQELLARVKEQVITGQQNHDIPFEQVVEIVRPTRSLAHNPIFQVGFSWQNLPEKISFAGLEWKPLDSMLRSVSKLDMTLWLRDFDDRIVGGIEYATALFERSSVEWYFAHF